MGGCAEAEKDDESHGRSEGWVVTVENEGDLALRHSECVRLRLHGDGLLTEDLIGLTKGRCGRKQPSRPEKEQKTAILCLLRIVLYNTRTLEDFFYHEG